MTTSVDVQPSIPDAPRTVAETGLSIDLILQIIIKTLHLAGELAGTDLADRLGVPFGVIEPALMQLKRDQHAEIGGGSMVGPSSYRYRLTDGGRTRAAMYLRESRYVGHLPVPLAQYNDVIHRVAARRLALSRETLGRAFSHLVLSTRVVDQLGPAIANRHSLFIYGPPGNGKTVISQAIRNVRSDDIAVPHAVAVDDHIIRVYDPVHHEPLDTGEQTSGLARAETFDGRWVRCRRPLVTAGGELTMDALELGYGETSGFYRAPLQMIANGGVLVIDDFGRQRATPTELLNRWIVPLESRIDYLTLRTGQKFEIPFDAFVVFATNLRPSDLVDEAFLRRIRYKVLASSPSDDEFVRIFEGCCREREVPFEPRMAEQVLVELRARNIRLRGCHPRDLIDQALSVAEYRDGARVLTSELLSEACLSYFVEDEDLATA